MSIEIREYKESDAEDVKRLFSEFVCYHSDLDEIFAKTEGHNQMFTDYIRSNIGNEKFLCLVAESEGRIWGYCISKIDEKPPVYPEPEYGVIDNLCVDEKFQKKGTGTLLMEESVKWLKSKGVKRVECFVAVSNPKATNFWRKMGFTTFTEQMYLNID